MTTGIPNKNTSTSVNTFARIVKKVEQVKNSDITLALDDELFASLKANKTYAFILGFFLNSGVTPDMKYTFQSPTGTTGLFIDTNWSSTSPSNTRILTSIPQLTTGANDAVLMISGLVKVGSTAGIFGIQWAQNVLDAGDTKVLQGSFLIIWEETA